MGYVSVAFHTPALIEVDVTSELEVLPVPERDLDRSQGLLEHFHAFVLLLDREFEHNRVVHLVLDLELHPVLASIATDEVGCDIDGLGNCGLDQFYYRSGSLSRSSASFATTLAEYSFRNSLNSDSVLVLFR